MIIRLPIEQIATSKRATQGVRLIKLNDEQKVATIAIVAKTIDEIDEEFEDGFNEITEENEQKIEVENIEE